MSEIEDYTELKHMVKEFLAVENDLKKENDKLKDKKNKKKELLDQIKNFLVENNQESFSYKDFSFSINKTKKQKKITKDVIKDVVYNHVQNENKCLQIVDDLYKADSDDEDVIKLVKKKI